MRILPRLLYVSSPPSPLVVKVAVDTLRLLVQDYFAMSNFLDI